MRHSATPRATPRPISPGSSKKCVPRSRAAVGRGPAGELVRRQRACSQSRTQWEQSIIVEMAAIHISEAEAARDFAALLTRVRGGAEIVIESGSAAVAILRAPAPPRRSIEECIALLPADSTATIDEDFADDVHAAVAAHREPLHPPAWD